MNRPETFIKQLKIIKIGNSAGVILPKEVLERLRLEVGDSLSCNQTPDGIALAAKDPEFDRQMAEARSIMKRYRNALSELAK
jgi:putative addiction module antidote